MFKVVGVDPGTVNCGVVAVTYSEKTGYRVVHKKVHRIKSTQVGYVGKRTKRQIRSGYCTGLGKLKAFPKLGNADMCVVENQDFGEGKTRLLFHGVQWGVAGLICGMSTNCEVQFIDSASKFTEFKKLSLEVESGKSKRTKTKDKSMALASSLITRYCVKDAEGISDNDHLSDAFGLAMCALQRRLRNDESLKTALI